MARPAPAENLSDKFYTRTEARALTGVPDGHAFREYAALKLIHPRRLANGLWLYSHDDIQAMRDERRHRGRPVPKADGFR